MDNLIRSRQDFENYVFDTLVTSLIPDSFWDPVKVCLPVDTITNLKKMVLNSECLICNDQKQNYSELPCCKNNFCDDCIAKWFCESVKCPFCNSDLRLF
jgi:hypothetical protein